MIRVITLANGRRVTIGQYVKAIKLAKANPDATFKHGLTGWWPVTGREVLAQFRQMVQDLINRHRPPVRDTRDPSTRLLKRLRIHGRECRWCGQRFKPAGLWQTCCCDSCQRSYRS